jgi:hypothetical protein
MQEHSFLTRKNAMSMSIRRHLIRTIKDLCLISFATRLDTLLGCDTSPRPTKAMAGYNSGIEIDTRA